MISTVCFHMNHKAHLACNFNYLLEYEGLLKVTASQDVGLHCKCGKISETVPDRVIVTREH